ncbi:MAG: DNA repair protein RadA [Clostridia bacterium]|nr:DNA repair protein RadA [Clostridia bacterium]
MKKGSIFACGVCGHETPKWLGKCPVCEGWNTFQEVTAFTSSRPAERHERHGAPVLLAETGPDDAASRLRTGEGEFDRILGGGLIPGTLLLLGGEPGVGKSTLLLQVAAGLQKQGGTVLYVSGEESLLQLKTRAKRLGLLETGVLFYQENEIEHILEEAEKIHPSALVIDSIQTMRSAGTPGLPGSPAQVRDVVQALLVPAKTWGMVCLLVGHITKSGLLAGPKLIEHMVDVVLYFEGDNRYPCRVLRVTKNRFGSSREIALYDLNEEGIQPVENPSAMLLEGRRPGQSGTVVTPVLEGSLPLLVEVQALVSGGNPGNPRRLVTGLDYQRVAMVLAVLEKRGGLPLAGRDVYVAAIGGVRAEEPACDLAVALAVASSFYDRPLPHDLAAFGELGLTGEIRRVGGGAKRWEAIQRHGFTRAVVPRGMPEKAVEGVEVTKVDTVGEMLAAMMKMKGG